MRTHRSFLFVFSLVLYLFSLAQANTFADTGQKIYKSVEELSRVFNGSWEDAFSFVRDNIRYEPSPHLLKTSQGVLWGNSGNSLEQTLLLGDVLKEMGEKVRLVSGRLNPAEAAHLITSLFPEKSNFSYASDIPLSQPAADKHLLTDITTHFWLQIQQDQQWLDLDPSFPEALPGKTYTEIDKTYGSLSTNMCPKMLISFSVEKGKTREDVIVLEKELRDMVNQPITFSISATLQEPQEEKSGSGSPAGAFGGLGRATSSKKKTQGIEAVHQAHLIIKQGMQASGKFTEMIPESPDKAVKKDIINRAWLHFRLTLNGKALLESERILFEKHQTGDEFPLFQRHSILITANSIPFESWEDKLRDVSDDRLLAQVKAEVKEIRESLRSKKDKKSLLKKSLSLEKKLGRDLGHLINMIFAYTSDIFTADAGAALSVFSYYSMPRIIITSIVGEGEHVKTVMDLRQDSISAIPFPGQALATKESFLYGRGIMESILEGRVLGLLSGKEVLTTAALMQQTADKGISTRLYSELELDRLDSLDMPDHVRQRAGTAIRSGAVLIIPDSAIRFDGQDRWGWWQITPETREAIGVLDTGLHQAMLQRTILETENALDARMGFMIGAITGAVDTQWLLAAKVLEYGEINQQALEEIKAYLKQINAYMCPSFEKTVSVELASVTVVDIEDCYKKAFSWSYGAGVKVEIGWCQGFAKGFACASTQLLNYYLRNIE